MIDNSADKHRPAVDADQAADHRILVTVLLINLGQFLTGVGSAFGPR